MRRWLTDIGWALKAVEWTVLLASFLVVAAQAQFAITPLNTFGTGGWLAPNGFNGSTYTYLTTNDTERGLAYGNGHLYLVSRNGGDFIRVLDEQTGKDLGALNLGSGVVTGGTFNVNMIAVGADGAIYAGNLAIGPTPFQVYRWANDLSNTVPTVAYSGVPLAGARLGDSLAAFRGGSATLLAAGFNSGPSVTGNNGYAIIDPTAGLATAIGFSSSPPAAGDFRLGISFLDATHVLGSQGGTSGLLYTLYSGTDGTTLANPSLVSVDERPLAFALVGGLPVLATLGTADAHVSLYDMADPTLPALVAQANATTGALPPNNHNTGAIAWGRISRNSATLYVLSTDDGIQAFTVTVPAPVPPSITNQPQSQTVVEFSPATFAVGASGNPPPTYQWYRGGTMISGATNLSYTLGSAQLADSGAQFQVVVQNIIDSTPYAVTSGVATLTVLADVNPLTLVGAQQVGPSQVQASFSKRLSLLTATNLTNYRITFPAGSVVITDATLDASQTNVILTVSPLSDGATYTLVVNNLTDQSTPPNKIAADSRASFVASTFSVAGLGNPTPGPAQVVAGNGYDLSSGGADFGGRADQGGFSYQSRTGDFDVAVRLAGLTPSDVYAKAGLMARESLDPGSRFAAALATPAMVGCLFEWRDPATGVSGSSGNSPVNYPDTWLRLKRAGNAFSGYASFDGQMWTQLGTVTISMSSQVLLGFALSSHNTNQVTTAQFRDLGDVTKAVIGSVTSPFERLGPCSRRTGLVISEIMYQPAPRSDGRNLEFIEIYNSNPWWEDIGGYRLTGDQLFRFPEGTILPGGGFAVVAVSPSDLQAVYGIPNVFGPSAPAAKRSGLIQLRDEQDSILLELTFQTTAPWPVGANGTGHSIVLARPSLGEADPRAWAISQAVGGSPGMMEAYRPSPLRSVVINEFLAHPDSNHQGYIELYNHSANTVDLSGCVLTDDLAVNKFSIPTNTSIGPGGFVSFDFGKLGFALNPAGGLLLYKAPDGHQVLNAVTYEPQGLNVASGRWPDGAAEFYPLDANTPGAPNGDIRIGDIVLNEIMYKPISGDDDDQYVELYNQGTNAVDLGGWSFTAGITFTFPTNTVVAPGGYLVVAREQARLLSNYPQLNSSNTVGDFKGKLPHTGGRLALARPERLGATTNELLVVEDEVTYEIGGRWGASAHGGGSSLELIHPNTNHRLADNWADSDESSKSSWTNLEVNAVLDGGANYSGAAIDLVQLGLLDVGECLVDNIELRPGTTGANYIANPDFENGMNGWAPQGDHTRSSLETVLGGYQSRQCLHLRASDGVWTMFNSVQGSLTNTTLRSGTTATLRLKARWLRGSPEILMRVHGNWIELTGAMPVPANLGTPGLPNSQAVATPGPAIFEVQHAPAIPVAGQPVVVTARFHDENGLQPTLLYRLDNGPNPAPSYTSVAMVDDGTGGDAITGDGIYSARIPAQAGGRVVAFLVQARNSLGATTTFPKALDDNSNLPRECVIGFGDAAPVGSFDHEHVWMTQNWVNRWAKLGGLSNENQDGTFVDGNSGRIIYNWQGRYAGSPYHQYTGSPVTTVSGEHWTLPEDDKFLGTTSFNKQHLPGNGPLDDDTLQREQTSYWMARQLGVPWDYRRFYILYVNGNRHGPLMEDSQVPGGDLIKQHWPNDANGFLYKNNSWFEGTTTIDANGYMNFNMPSWCLLGRFTTTINGVPGQYKLGRYRWMYWIRQYPDSANNFTNVFALIDAANLSSGSSAYYTNMEALVDTEEWMRMSALEHATGDWDSWFTQNQWNMYIYKPTRGKWTALKWDWNITLGSGTTTWPADGSQLFNVGSNDPIMARFQTYIPYRRAYLRALKEMAAKAMNNTYVDPVLDAKYAAFVANGLTTTAYGLLVRNPSALKGWIGTMHTSLLRALTNQGVANVSFAVSGSTNLVVGTDSVGLSGTAPVEVKSISVNGVTLPVTWTTVKTWQMVVPLTTPTSVLGLQALDVRGDAISGMTATVWVTNTSGGQTNLNSVRINEWMANNNSSLPDPADGLYHDWFELYNPNFAIVDLSGYYLTDKLADKTKWRIPSGTAIGPYGFRLVWADGGLTNQDNELHANFKLAASGSLIALFDPVGNQVDAVTFGQQKGNVSQGRWPDGGSDIYFLTEATPNAPNRFINSAPVLAPLTDVAASDARPITFQASASDPDSPPQVLTFALDAGAPAGAVINATNGAFSWTPSVSQIPSTNRVTVRVTDNGVPPLSDSETLTIVVSAPGIVISQAALNPLGQFNFSWSTQPGRTYRVEAKTQLSDPVWLPLDEFVAGSSTSSFTDQTSSGATQRFYRISLLP